jgi:hypothetical protein
MIVTDVTRMEGERVCVGGYLDDGTAVRPVAGRAGPNETWLRAAHSGPVTPFSVVKVRMGWAPQPLVAPHSEDRTIPARGHRVLRTLPDGEQRAFLEGTRSPSVRAIFGADVHADPEGHWGRYVRAGEGERSLGTIRANGVSSVQYRHYIERGRWDYRLRFVDEGGEEFQLAVVDLAFRRRLDALRHDGQVPDAAARVVLDELRRQDVYLRIGLARGWEKHPDRCYLQITGVYGFATDAGG